ncbi:hypothetical protein L1987_33312 [Smallanthus sonchifolius]|uniref:Uncharacterized protein n=1 Tax=Smallanthus sonchifolius TaxID=185202 RepID=A0ACB9HQQ3_9ASTR|nr:hypothetical protein L1987_33312 [Smallanthus sonchifolius]
MQIPKNELVPKIQSYRCQIPKCLEVKDIEVNKSLVYVNQSLYDSHICKKKADGSQSKKFGGQGSSSEVPTNKENNHTAAIATTQHQYLTEEEYDWSFQSEESAPINHAFNLKNLHIFLNNDPDPIEETHNAFNVSSSDIDYESTSETLIGYTPFYPKGEPTVGGTSSLQNVKFVRGQTEMGSSSKYNRQRNFNVTSKNKSVRKFEKQAQYFQKSQSKFPKRKFDLKENKHSNVPKECLICGKHGHLALSCHYNPCKQINTAKRNAFPTQNKISKVFQKESVPSKRSVSRNAPKGSISSNASKGLVPSKA